MPPSLRVSKLRLAHAARGSARRRARVSVPVIGCELQFRVGMGRQMNVGKTNDGSACDALNQEHLDFTDRHIRPPDDPPFAGSACVGGLLPAFAVQFLAMIRKHRESIH